eukprot:scaffold11827_cov52-Phaeocystis_antarctica.AAC.2
MRILWERANPSTTAHTTRPRAVTSMLTLSLTPHYSSSGSVLHYLLRLEPFTTDAIQLQGGPSPSPSPNPSPNPNTSPTSPSPSPNPNPNLTLTLILPLPLDQAAASTCLTAFSTRSPRRGTPALPRCHYTYSTYYTCYAYYACYTCYTYYAYCTH